VDLCAAASADRSFRKITQRAVIVTTPSDAEGQGGTFQQRADTLWSSPACFLARKAAFVASTGGTKSFNTSKGRIEAA
jgi:hypothetical protein